MAKGGDLCTTDIQAWDWSMQFWELLIDADIRADLAGSTENSVFRFLLRVHAHVVGNSTFAMPDGELFEQTFPGGQLSGDYNTSSTNSRGRVCATLFARLKAGRIDLCQFLLGIKAMGDDSFEIWFQELVEWLEKIGHPVKQCTLYPGLKGFSFCSQLFMSRGVAYPEDYSKTLYRFLSHNPADPKYSEYRAQLLYYFRHLPEHLRQKAQRLADARVERAQTLAGLQVEIVTEQSPNAPIENGAPTCTNERRFIPAQ
jgi:hypothetical protein